MLFLLARKETKHMRSMYLVSPERTTRKSEVRSTADSKAGRIFEYEEEGNAYGYDRQKYIR